MCCVSTAGSDSDSSIRMLTPCPYVVSFYDAFVDAGEGTLNFVMEYMDGGSLEVGRGDELTPATAIKCVFLMKAWCDITMTIDDRRRGVVGCLCCQSALVPFPPLCLITRVTAVCCFVSGYHRHWWV